MTENIEIYTDGACVNNPGPGGWGAVLIAGDKQKEISGSVHDTTNQQMELLAAIKGLASLKERNNNVTIYSDSAYLINACQKGWLKGWKANNWRKSKDPLQNKFLWQWLDSLLAEQNVSFTKVKAHSGVKLNERVDDLAYQAASAIADNLVESKLDTSKGSYRDLLEYKAAEFIVKLQEYDLEAEIKEVFQYHVTVELYQDDLPCGNLRIYYKPSKDRYTLNFVEFNNDELITELETAWQYQSNHK